MTRIRDVLALATFAALLALLPGGAQAADQALNPDKPIIKVKPKPVVDTPLFTYIDNRLSYAYIYHTTDAGAFIPKAGGGYTGSIDQNVLAFTHFDSWQYGTNFLNIGIYKSAGPIDAAAPCTSPGLITDSGGTVAASCPGESDIYGLIRSTFGLNQIFDTHAFTQGPLQNISLEVGADADTSNSYLASQDVKGYVGLQFALDLPYKGFLDIAPLYKVEVGHSAFTQCGDLFALPAPLCNNDGYKHFKDTWAVEINYGMDLGFLPESIRYFTISGRVGVYGPKGPIQGIPGQDPTKTEINSEPIRLTFDAGRAIWGQKYTHEVDYWVAYRYWKNQFGYSDQSAPFICTVAGTSTNSCTSNTLATGITVKF